MLIQNSFKIIELLPQELWQLSEVKNYLRISDDYDDNLITNLIDTAISSAENFIGLSLVNRRIEFRAKLQKQQQFVLKYQPIRTITEIFTEKDENKTVLNNEQYYFDTTHSSLHLLQPINTTTLVVHYISGFSSNNTPSTIKYGILLHVAEMYDREAALENSFSSAVRNLYLPYRQLKI
ncbi:Phage gp6-like head-tail connector protein [Candidatus Trichorickettsia mobilis]|uniref:Phage gp6-like head-tail connector protein n=1 Tax=Candidatus Trichorickettsia mobilis TaxID=1346319 RepID=A0ABZ0URF1_9RICK|nr:head-tail connector protein [Candidatus Trichorickettsia mobilis]WPY00223.1 Phage gp6-like head-tail connector protein [Candidatus Trichorickettsia mobilis]